jgi:hypothetical protein
MIRSTQKGGTCNGCTSEDSSETHNRETSRYRSYTEQSFSGLDTDASVLALIRHAQRVGLNFYQCISDPYRVMFDATQFNALGGYTAAKGIKGDFLARIRRKSKK